jgi:YegS/Rv2252/BmrU family lipid kinase
VVNPRAAAGKTGRRWVERESMLRGFFPLGEVLFTRGPGDATHIALDAVERGQDFIIAVGGDGTVFEVVNGMMQALDRREAGAKEVAKGIAEPVLGVWPAGSGSDFARGIGVPGEIGEALQLLVHGDAREADVGRIRCLDSDGAEVQRYYINAVDFGLGAVVCEKLQRRPRFLPGRPTYLWQTVSALITFRNPAVELSVDGAAFERHRIKSVVVANNAYFGGGMCIAPGAAIDDGELDLVIIGDLGRFEAIRRLGETFSGNRIHHRDVHYSRCRRLEARAASRVPLEADGELVGELPATIDLAARRLQVVTA